MDEGIYLGNKFLVGVMSISFLANSRTIERTTTCAKPKGQNIFEPTMDPQLPMIPPIMPLEALDSLGMSFSNPNCSFLGDNTGL